jgi:hypothetical protein
MRRWPSTSSKGVGPCFNAARWAKDEINFRHRRARYFAQFGKLLIVLDLANYHRSKLDRRLLRSADNRANLSWITTSPRRA